MIFREQLSGFGGARRKTKGVYIGLDRRGCVIQRVKAA